MEKPINLNSQNVYEIMVRGDIDMCWLKGFGEVQVQKEITSGTGNQLTPFKFQIITDQAGLVGLIRRMHGLGIVLLSIRLVNTSNI